MDTKNENGEWQDNSRASGADTSQDGNKVSDGNRNGANRLSYNQNSNNRPSRPRFNPNNRDNGGNRPRYNNEGGGDHSYRPHYNSYNNHDNNGGDRPFRPRYNNNEAGGEHSSPRPPYNPENRDNNSGDRPYRPRYNNSEPGGDRPAYRPRNTYNNHDANNGGDRPYRPRYNNNEAGGEHSSARPHYNNTEGGGARPPYRPSYNNSYNNRDNNGNRDANGGDRPYRPRYNNGGGDRPAYRPRFNDNRQQGYRPRTDDYDPNAKYSVKKQIEYKEQYIDPNQPIRLNKFLANAGVCSRREADEFIQAGVVLVNGIVVTELGTKIKRTDDVKFHDQAVRIERKVYVLLNKPKDCVTTSDDPQERHTVMDMVKGACQERIYPVGRLDRNTTGVLLLTNDGDLASKLTHPKFLKKKIYHVSLDKNVARADLDKIISGVTLDDGEIHADAAEYVDEEKKDQIGIEIHSGKNRIVRRMFESLGYRVVKLDRVFFAGLTKKGLRRGEWRYLTEQEVDFLRMGSFE